MPESRHWMDLAMSLTNSVIDLRTAVLHGGRNPGHRRCPEQIAPLLECATIEKIGLPELAPDCLLGIGRLIVFTSLESATGDQLQLLEAFGGTSGNVSIYLHEASLFERTNHRFRQFLGVRFERHDPIREFGVIAHRHPFTTDCPERFTIFDERYTYDTPFSTSSNTRVFLTCADQGVPLGFERFVNKGWVIYMALGHNERALSSAALRSILLRIGRTQIPSDGSLQFPFDGTSDSGA